MHTYAIGQIKLSSFQFFVTCQCRESLSCGSDCTTSLSLKALQSFQERKSSKVIHQKTLWHLLWRGSVSLRTTSPASLSSFLKLEPLPVYIKLENISSIISVEASHWFINTDVPSRKLDFLKFPIKLSVFVVIQVKLIKYCYKSITCHLLLDGSDAKVFSCCPEMLQKW